MSDLSGYVKAVLSKDDGSVEVAMSPPGNPSHYDFCYVTDLTYEKNLVMISVFRDALVHSLPVEVRCTDKDKIVQQVSIRDSILHGKPPAALSDLSGYVKAVLSKDDGTVEVQVYPPGNPSQVDSCYIKDLTNDKNVVMISAFRDALVHSLPVGVKFTNDKNRFVQQVYVRSPLMPATAPAAGQPSEKVVKGKILGIRLTDSGTAKDRWVTNGEAEILIPMTLLYLDLRRPTGEIKMTQLSLLRYAYENDKDVTVSYQELDKKNYIIGVELGQFVLGELHVAPGEG
jgi:hypothetical protein